MKKLLKTTVKPVVCVWRVVAFSVNLQSAFWGRNLENTVRNGKTVWYGMWLRDQRIGLAQHKKAALSASELDDLGRPGSVLH